MSYDPEVKSIFGEEVLSAILDDALKYHRSQLWVKLQKFLMNNIVFMEVIV